MQERKPLQWDDPNEFERLRAVLLNAGFTNDGIRTSIGLEKVPERDLISRELWLRRMRGDDGPLATLVRLFLITIPVDIDGLRRAIVPMSVESLCDAGLIRINGSQATANVHLIPYGDLWLCYDLTLRDDARMSSDYVMGVGSSSRSLANCTVRRPHSQTLDLGTGCGIQAFNAVPHSDHVVAVDRNARAVAITAFNAALNGITNVEALEGDMFLPVEGRKFDLIVSNPPFVISPASDYIYRDSGQQGDEVCRQIVKQAGKHLNEGGYCELLCNWAHVDGQDVRQRLSEWFEGSGCDAWVLRCETQEAAVYAHTWISHTESHSDNATRGKLFDLWMDYYDEAKIIGVSFGLIIMRRTDKHPNWIRLDDAPSGALGVCGDHVQRCFAALDFLAALPDDDAFLDTVLRVAPDMLMETQLAPGDNGWMMAGMQLRLNEGLEFIRTVGPYLGRIITQFREPATLRSLIGDTSDNSFVPVSAEHAPPIAETVMALKQFVGQGFLIPVV